MLACNLVHQVGGNCRANQRKKDARSFLLQQLLALNDRQAALLLTKPYQGLLILAQLRLLLCRDWADAVENVFYALTESKHLTVASVANERVASSRLAA